jgi:hypothetical protein
MAAVVAPKLERIIRDARVLLNQPKAENSRFSDAELTGYANDAIQQIFLTVNEAGEGQFDQITSDVSNVSYPGLNTTNGIDSIALPADCFAIKGVWFKQGTMNRRLEYRQNVMMDYDTTNTNSGQTTYEPYYYLRGNSLVLRPIPGFTSTDHPITIEYTAYPNVLVYGGDSMDNGISPLFKELIVMYTVAKAKLKDDLSGGGTGYQLAAQHRDDLFRQFKHQVMERSKAPIYITSFEPI